MNMMLYRSIKTAIAQGDGYSMHVRYPDGTIENYRFYAGSDGADIIRVDYAYLSRNTAGYLTTMQWALGFARGHDFIRYLLETAPQCGPGWVHAG